MFCLIYIFPLSRFGKRQISLEDLVRPRYRFLNKIKIFNYYWNLVCDLKKCRRGTNDIFYFHNH